MILRTLLGFTFYVHTLPVLFDQMCFTVSNGDQFQLCVQASTVMTSSVIMNEIKPDERRSELAPTATLTLPRDGFSNNL